MLDSWRFQCINHTGNSALEVYGRCEASCKVLLQALASDLLTHATELTRQQGVPSQQRFHMCRQVIIACTERGLHCLQAKDAADALKLLDHAFQLITGHLVMPCSEIWPLLLLQLVLSS